jgi:hypothetical protein
MAIFGRGGGNSQTKIANIRITQSVQGNNVPVVMGSQRIQQALVWMGGFSAQKETQGGKGGGKSGSFYLYSADVLAALCSGPVTGIGDAWSGQSWLNATRAAESITIASVYAPANAVLLIADNGVAIANTYSQSYTDYGAPAATVLSGSDLSSLIQVSYGTVLTTGHYSINPASIGTFVLTSVANASGGNTVYTGTFTGGTSPYGSGASNAYIGFRFVIKGFTNALNNGTFVCVASTATTVTLVNASGVAETHAATAQETGNTYHFAAADVGKTAIINYQFHLQALLAQELDLIPAGKVITVGGTFTPITDLGVRYYNPGGANDGTALTPVTITPTVAGTYKFHDNGSGGGGGATYTFATGDIGAEVRIKYGFQNNAAVGADAPTTLNFQLIGGGQSQAPWSTLTAKYPQAALGYTKIALVAYAPMSLGTSAQAQDNTFEVITPDAFGGGVVDCNPVKCIFRVLTDTSWGLGSGLVPFPLACIDNGVGGTWGGAAGTPGARVSDSSAWNWFAANSFFISPILDSQGSAASHIGKWLEAGMCAAYMSEGLLKLVPYGDTSTAGNGCTWIAPQNFVVALDDTCYLGKDGEDPVQIKRVAWQDAFNEVQVQWNNRSNQYAPEITPDFDQASINRYGLRIEDPQSWDFICTLTAAKVAASLRVKRSVNIRNTYTFNLPFTYSYLEPMDIVLISTSSVWAAGLNNVNLAVNNLPVRIKRIVDDPVDGLEITAEDYPWGTHQPVLFNKGISAGDVVLNMFVEPGNTQAVMFEASNRLTGFDGNQIWIGALGQTNNWGGCNVWVSIDGTKYQMVGDIRTPARLGLVHSTFASGADPDTTNSLVVDLAENSQPLESGTTTDADKQTTLCYVDGEIIAYSNAAVTGQNQYTLSTYIRRAQMGTVAASHSAATVFMRLDSAVFKYTYDPTYAGLTLFFKFQSVNSFGNQPQDLSTLTATSFTVPGLNPGTVDASSGLIAVHGIRAAHSSYRPLSNPLSATDAGATATISIAAFSMRVPGISDISLNSGTITGLAFSTGYYLYYDDPLYAGGAVTYQATTTKETALNNTGRFFVGSIKTPVDGGVDTTGNNDGGTGAQAGTRWIISPSLMGDNSVSPPNFQPSSSPALDGDSSTFGSTGTVITLYLSGFAPFRFAWKSLVLNIRTQVISTAGGGTSFCGYSLDGGTSWTTIYSLSGPATRALTTDVVTLPTGQALNLIQVRYGHATLPGNMRMYESWVEGEI